ncbi:MAG: putative toxin-antitoxin system toxin component, PIN family [Actinomycetota bacterium]
MRVVLDTNVFVSAYVFPGGAPEQVMALAIDGRLQVITSKLLLLELGRVLQDKFGWDAERAEIAIAQILRVGEVVIPREVVEDIRADPPDNRVLEAAAEGGCERIISGDRHLLKLRAWRGIPIQDPRAFLTEFE